MFIREVLSREAATCEQVLGWFVVAPPIFRQQGDQHGGDPDQCGSGADL